MSTRSRSRHSSTSETESVTDLSSAESVVHAPSQQQRFILAPNMYYHDTVYRTYSYAQPIPKNFPPVIQQDMNNTVSTCVKQPEAVSYRYRYYAPSGPIPASRLVKGEAAPPPKRYEQSMSFQNFQNYPPRMYPPSPSYDISCRNVNFDPMFESRHLEQYNRPVSNMWQMQGSTAANTTTSSQKFLNQYPVDVTPANGYANFYQDKSLFNKFYNGDMDAPNVGKFKNNFKLKALGIIGLIFLAVISLAVVLSVMLTRNSISARSLMVTENVSERVAVFNMTETNSTYSSLVWSNANVTRVNLTETKPEVNVTVNLVVPVLNNLTVLELNETFVQVTSTEIIPETSVTTTDVTTLETTTETTTTESTSTESSTTTTVELTTTTESTTTESTTTELATASTELTTTTTELETITTESTTPITESTTTTTETTSTTSIPTTTSQLETTQTLTIVALNSTLTTLNETLLTLN